MNQNTTSVDNDLQKAIDDITNNTNTDPVFSDPIAAPSSIPEGDDGVLAEPVGPFPEPITPPVETLENATPEPTAPNYDYYTTPIEPEQAPEPEEPEIPEPQTQEPAIPPMPEPTPEHSGLGMNQVKEAALRDLVPLMDKISLSPSQKFRIYRDMFENLRDYTVLEPAYRTAAEIPDERERAEALLYLVESIDKM